MLLHRLPNDGNGGLLPLLLAGGLETVGKALEHIGDDGVDKSVRQGSGLGRAYHAELELVSGEGEGRGAVAVGVIPKDIGQLRGTQTHIAAVGVNLTVPVGGLFQHAAEVIAEEHGDNGRRGLIAAKTVVVVGGSAGQPQQVGVAVHPFDEGAEHQLEQQVVLRVLARGEKVDAVIGDEGVVVVLARAVDPAEGLLVQQAGQALLLGDNPHHIHHNLVAVAVHIGDAKDAGQLVLGGGALVVLALCRNAQLPEAAVQLMHKVADADADPPAVVVVQLLGLGGLGAEEGAPAELEVKALLIPLPVHQEVLLLVAAVGGQPAGGGVAHGAQQADALLIQRGHRAQLRGLDIQSLSGVGTESSGNVEGLIPNKGRGGRIPGGIASGLKGGPQASRREGGGVRLRLDQVLSGKFIDNIAIVILIRHDEGLMLSGRDVVHRLEPVSIVGRSVFNGPVAHGGGDSAGDGAVQLGAHTLGELEAFVYIAGQAFGHNGIGKCHCSIDFGNVHTGSSFLLDE